MAATENLLATDTVLLVDTDSDDVVVQVYAADSDSKGLLHWIKNIGSNTLTISGTVQSVKIDGEDTLVLAQYESVQITNDGAAFWSGVRGIPTPLTSDLDMGGYSALKIKGLGGVVGNAVVYLGGASDLCYTTLAAAIAALPASGGTVCILPGYTETITASVVPVGNCAIICPTRDAVITVGGVGAAINMINMTGLSYITLNGVKLVGRYPTYNDVGIVGGTAYCEAINCYFATLYRDNYGNITILNIEDVVIAGKYNDHIIKNGSFENFTGGEPDEWSRKP